MKFVEILKQDTYDHRNWKFESPVRQNQIIINHLALAIVRGNAFSIITAAGQRTAFDP